jgi:SSS family solute:Na+ symporter
VNLYLALLLAYSGLQVALGLWLSRHVRSSGDFFVAGRALGPGLLFATLIAANIGAGSTVGATGLGYRDGLAAWWWVGSAGIGSLLLALTVGPRMRAVAAQEGLRTVGDYLEWRYHPSVRATISLLLWVGTLAILAGQLIALAWILDVVVGVPKPAGCLIGALVVTTYFGAGGLHASARVNILQASVKFFGFALALPLVLMKAGGLAGLRSLDRAPGYWDFLSGGGSGWQYVALLSPAFIVSPGILQKVYGARDERAVRLGVGTTALVLLLYAIVPAILGIAARALHPDLPNQELALPTLLTQDVPPWIGAIGVAAVFSAELSAADAILFMLSTSLSQDLYRRFLDPGASDARGLLVARAAAVLGGAGAAALAIVSPTVIGVLSVFYSLLGVSLFVPIVAGLYVRRAGTPEALGAIVAGVAGLLLTQAATGGRGFGTLSPPLVGLMAAALACGLSTLLRRPGPRRPTERLTGPAS